VVSDLGLQTALLGRLESLDSYRARTVVLFDLTDVIYYKFDLKMVKNKNRNT
jgi:hypothetical protein